MDLKLDDWESFLYESRPFSYLSIGVYALSVEKVDLVLIGLAMVLVFCGILVLRMRFKNRKGSTLESLYYESLPFIYLSLGIYAIVFFDAARIAVGSGVILLFCATKVFHWRYRNRRAIADQIGSGKHS